MINQNDQKIYCKAEPPLNIKVDMSKNNEFIDLSFHWAILTELLIQNDIFRHCNFRESYLVGSNIFSSHFKDCHLGGIKANYAKIHQCKFINCIYFII